MYVLAIRTRIVRMSLSTYPVCARWQCFYIVRIPRSEAVRGAIFRYEDDLALIRKPWSSLRRRFVRLRSLPEPYTVDDIERVRPSSFSSMDMPLPRAEE